MLTNQFDYISAGPLVSRWQLGLRFSFFTLKFGLSNSSEVVSLFGKVRTLVIASVKLAATSGIRLELRLQWSKLSTAQTAWHRGSVNASQPASLGLNLGNPKKFLARFLKRRYEIGKKFLLDSGQHSYLISSSAYCLYRN